MVLSREFADAIKEFVGQWQAKEFTDVEDLAAAIANLHELAEKESELDLVDLDDTEADG
jgi:hypothetical protein